MLAQGIVAVSKTLPDQRVTSASMYFPKAAAFDAPLDVDVDVLREGPHVLDRRGARLAGRRSCAASGCTSSTSGAPDVIDGSVAMPDVGGPLDARAHDMRVTGRDLRIVDGDYRPDPDRVGPPGDQRVDPVPATRPTEPYLHDALLAQPTTHWTIAAAMLPHPGYRRGAGARDAVDRDHGREHRVPRRGRRDAVAPLLQPRDPRRAAGLCPGRGPHVHARTAGSSRRTRSTR